MAGSENGSNGQTWKNIWRLKKWAYNWAVAWFTWLNANRSVRATLSVSQPCRELEVQIKLDGHCPSREQMASDNPTVRLPIDDVRKRLERLPEWQLDSQGERLVRSWKMQDFAAAIKFLNRIAELAEVLGHHPDFHLERYRHLRIEIWTHSIGGLTERDFSLAAQIDALEVPAA